MVAVAFARPGRARRSPPARCWGYCACVATGLPPTPGLGLRGQAGPPDVGRSRSCATRSLRGGLFPQHSASRDNPVPRCASCAAPGASAASARRARPAHAWQPSRPGLRASRAQVGSLPERGARGPLPAPGPAAAPEVVMTDGTTDARQVGGRKKRIATPAFMNLLLSFLKVFCLFFYIFF